MPNSWISQTNVTIICPSAGLTWVKCSWYLFLWFANLTKFWILKVRIFVIGYFQFKTEKKRVWLVNIFCWTNKRFISSIKKKENKYSYFKIQNLVKLEEIPRTQISYFEVRKSQPIILTHNCHRVVLDFDCMLSKRSKTKQNIFCEFMKSWFRRPEERRKKIYSKKKIINTLTWVRYRFYLQQNLQSIVTWTNDHMPFLPWFNNQIK